MTTTTTRAELFHAISEVTKEMYRKLETDFDNCEFSYNGREFWVAWQCRDDDQRCDELKSSEDSPDTWISSIYTRGFKIGFSFVRSNKGYDSRGNSRYKYYPIVFITSKVKDDLVFLRTNLKFYEHFRKEIRDLKKMLKHSRAVRVTRSAIQVEHHLAKMIPDRLDNILLGGEDVEKRER